MSEHSVNKKKRNKKGKSFKCPKPKRTHKQAFGEDYKNEIFNLFGEKNAYYQQKMSLK